jgi:heme A synthase
MGTLISLLVFALILGLIFWLLTKLPLDATVKQIIQIIVVVIAILYLLGGLGFYGNWRFR